MMNREKAREILGENATEEQITNLLNQWHIDESSKVKDLESKVNSLTEQNNKYSDYDTIKKQLDDINKANMTEQEKIDQMKKETENNLRESRRIVNTAKAKEILAGLDLDDELISLVVSDDSQKTIDSANKLKAKFDSQKEIVTKKTQEDLTKLNVQPTISNVTQNDNAMNFEKFSNMSADEQNKWLAENPNGLENLK